MLESAMTVHEQRKNACDVACPLVYIKKTKQINFHPRSNILISKQRLAQCVVIKSTFFYTTLSAFTIDQLFRSNNNSLQNVLYVQNVHVQSV